jgi:hypothetical protein
VSLGDLLWACLTVIVLSIPLALSMWALLDAARRPAWAWALAGRSQALWIANVLLGILCVVLGLAVSSWYLLKVRPVIEAAEQGRF